MWKSLSNLVFCEKIAEYGEPVAGAAAGSCTDGEVGQWILLASWGWILFS